MIARARKQAGKLLNDRVDFEEADIVSYRRPGTYSLVLSNNTMHWVQPVEEGYKRLFELLRDRGHLAIHQGGHGTYRALRELAVGVASDLGLAACFDNWRYPHYYPTVDELRDLLSGIGFTDVSITSNQTRGLEYDGLYRDFAAAGLAPFLDRVPVERHREFRNSFVSKAERLRPETFTHNLYVTAVKE
jgi:trans-aconitate methyltransferase